MEDLGEPRLPNLDFRFPIRGLTGIQTLVKHRYYNMKSTTALSSMIYDVTKLASSSTLVET